MLQPLEGVCRSELARLHGFQKFQQFKLIHILRPAEILSSHESYRLSLTCPNAAARLNLPAENMAETQKQIVTVGVTGASGAILAQKMLALLEEDARVARVHLVVTEAGQRLFAEELGITSGD